MADIVQLYVADKTDSELLRRAVQLEALPANWRDYFAQRLKEAS